MGTDFINNYQFYKRAQIDIKAYGIPFLIKTIYGSSGYDSQSHVEQTALSLLEKLFRKKKSGIISPAMDSGVSNVLVPHSPFPIPHSLNSAPGFRFPILIHEPGQGFFPCQLYALIRHIFNQSQNTEADLIRMVFSGRNILALEVTRYNFYQCSNSQSLIVPAADLKLGAEALQQASIQIRSETEKTNEAKYSLIIVFPELLAQNLLPKDANQLEVLWENIRLLLCAGGLFVAGFSSTDAQRFDHKKPAGFSRLGELKRKGVKALIYEKNGDIS